MEKYNLIPEQLVYEGSIGESNLYIPEALSEADILLTHTPEYWQKLKTQQLTPKEIRKTGFPLSPLLVQRGRVIANGSIQNALLARQYGVAMNAAGGTHHAFADRGEGFCLLNDFAIAANYLLQRGVVKKILIVDLDVHQGNGSAHIFRNDPRVFTFSMHCEANYPLKKEQSDLDIGLQSGTDDKSYLKQLCETLPMLMDTVQPELVFYQAGVDILHTDKLGKLGVTPEGCRQRDAFVFKTCKSYAVPVAVSMGGGYSARLRDIVEAHCNTFREALACWF